MNENVTRPHKGLHIDTSPQDQPKHTYRWALNAVVESKGGDLGFIGNEQSNEECASFPEGYIPLGKEYIGEGQTVILLVKDDETLSEIGILDDKCEYETHVNADLGFKVSHQIDVTYRLRRGCERTIYWVDGCNNKPMVFNFDKPEDYKDAAGNWDVDEFSLYKTYNNIPRFEDVTIEEGGNLLPGSYNFAIQYLDEDFNPTEWITTDDTTVIYNDNPTSKDFRDVRGSTNEVSIFRDYGATNKSIRVDFSNFDPSYPFYRVAIIEATTGSGRVSRVLYSDKISTQISSFNYTGSEGFTEGTVEEIQQFNNVIYSAEHIEQIENRLVLANTKGKQINYCAFQKHASKITSDLVFKEIVLNNIDIEDNQKRGELHFEKLGYMPGEIYSFGIVYVLDDGTITPAFHIPGKNPSYASQMSDDNELSDTYYIDNSNCGVQDLWSVDSQGDGLLNQRVRHHRFPLRSEVNKPLFVENSSSTTITNYYLYIDITGEIDPAYGDAIVSFQVDYTINGVPFSQLITFNLANYDPTIGLLGNFVAQSTDPIVFVGVIELADPNNPAVFPGLTYTDVYDSSQVISDDSVYTSEIMGINFSNIEVPDLSKLTDCKVVGYYIVRQHRSEENKTILDNGIMTPLIVEKRAGVDKFVAHGHVAPNTADLKEDVFALIHPEHKFRGLEYPNTTEFIKEGEYVITSRNISDEIVQDVQPGTSYDSSVNRRRERDSDGFDLHVMTRNNNLNYVRTDEVLAQVPDIEDIFYLDTLYGKPINDINGDRKEIYNLSADNKIGIVHLNKTLDINEIRDKLPYVVMKRKLDNPYSAFRVLPYYKETANPVMFVNDNISSTTIFNGDSYISPMRYLSSMFYDIRIKSRRTKTGVWNWVVGILSIIAGATLIITGVGVPAGIAVIGFGVSQIATGMTKGQISRVYKELYEQGLKDTVDDNDTQVIFGPNPPDDEIQYFFDVLTNVWVESSVNMNWRMGNTIGLTDFLNSPDGYNEAELNTYAIEKVTTVDAEADGGRNYQGYVKAELYDVNEDYRRRDREKVFFHIPIEYDCCSNCIEKFPHRIHYSEQAFQEELTDNYRKFLPNNYRDIEGETGEITNVFRIQNNLYVHTREALWHLPQNIQERITDQVVSFIGTGNYFSIPPRVIIDDDTGHSAGNQHKWGTVKTPHGVFFNSERQGKVYLFNGNNLKPISSQGLFSWFKENSEVRWDRQYLNDNDRVYPYRDNTSNLYGTGFISVYDSRYERIIFTKIDKLLPEELIESKDYEVCVTGNTMTIFQNYSQTIAQELANGWNFIGIRDCEMCFERLDYETKIVKTLGKDDIMPKNETKDFPLIDCKCISGEVVELDNLINNSWTISYSIKFDTWTSWHSYMPNFYIHTPNKFYSWSHRDNVLWKHNREHHYQNFYGIRYPYIIDYVSLSNPLQTRLWNHLILQTEAKKFDEEYQDFTDQRFITFNKLIAYNTRQSTGLLNLIVKDEELNSQDYLSHQVQDLSADRITIDRNERNWSLNELRDVRIDYTLPSFNKNLNDLQNNYYIDKIINTNSIDFNKNWTNLEPFRDKYLEIRLIFDTFDDVKLLLNYSVENENQSFR